jgi:hypothetical protein
MWCNLMQLMPTRADYSSRGRKRVDTRVSITIPHDDYVDLKKTAGLKRVSLAWVVRDALRDYLRRTKRAALSVKDSDTQSVGRDLSALHGSR